MDVFQGGNFKSESKWFKCCATLSNRRFLSVLLTVIHLKWWWTLVPSLIYWKTNSSRQAISCIADSDFDDFAQKSNSSRQLQDGRRMRISTWGHTVSRCIHSWPARSRIEQLEPWLSSWSQDRVSWSRDFYSLVGARIEQLEPGLSSCSQDWAVGAQIEHSWSQE